MTFNIYKNYGIDFRYILLKILVMNVTHCIFDLDGLLLDTESIYTECLQELCAPYGKNFSTETKLEIMGKSSLEAGQILIRMLEFFINKFNIIFFSEKLNLPITDEEFLIKSNELYQQAFPSAELLPGAERLIQHLAAHNIPMGKNKSNQNSI